MNTHWRHFKKKRTYLLRYLATSLIISITLVIGLFQLTTLSPLQLNMNSLVMGLALLPLGLTLAVIFPTLIHNCVHGNFRRPWMNQVVGELAGFYVLLGMAAFEINHRMHHVHHDTALDPHNPEKQSFFFFFFKNNFAGTGPVLEKFLQYHGDTKANRQLFSLCVFLHFINVPIRLLAWILLLGPELFVVFFIPSYLFHMFVFAHINYVTHEIKDDHSVHIYNLDSNLYYKFVNLVGFGVYYHKNHHLNPNHFNPKLGASSSALVR